MDGTFQIAERGLSGADVVGRLTAAAAAASASASGGASGGASGQGSVKRPRLERDASDEQLLFLLKNLDKVRRTKKVSEVLKIFISFLFYSVDRNRPGGLRFRGRRAAALLGQAGNPRKTPTSRRLADAVTSPSAHPQWDAEEPRPLSTPLSFAHFWPEAMKTIQPWNFLFPVFFCCGFGSTFAVPGSIPGVVTPDFFFSFWCCCRCLLWGGAHSISPWPPAGRKKKAVVLVDHFIAAGRVRKDELLVSFLAQTSRQSSIGSYHYAMMGY